MFLNKLRIPTGTSYKSHLAMALKILETPPDVLGDIVECGTWRGGSAANLSLICKMTNRKLKIFDSFEGLPESSPEDRQGGYETGDYAGSLADVKKTSNAMAKSNAANLFKAGSKILCRSLIRRFYWLFLMLIWNSVSKPVSVISGII